MKLSKLEFLAMTYMKKTFLPDSTEWAKLMERMSEQDKNVSSHLIMSWVHSWLRLFQKYMIKLMPFLLIININIYVSGLLYGRTPGRLEYIY